MKAFASLLAAALLASPALAQRPAISSALSPEAAQSAFETAVMEACIPAVTAPNGMASLSAAVRSRLSPTNDVETRTQAGAAQDEVMWDVNAAKGVVTIHEKAGRCVVSVYGPPAIVTVMALSQKIVSAGFEPMATATLGLGQTLTRKENGKRVMVVVSGSEPGMPGHKSGFSVVTATVFASP